MFSNTEDEIIKSQSDDLSSQKWLDSKFFEEHLQNYYKNKEIQVIDFEQESVKGDNFSSDIHRVNVSFSVPAKESALCEREVSAN